MAGTAIHDFLISANGRLRYVRKQAMDARSGHDGNRLSAFIQLPRLHRLFMWRRVNKPNNL